MSVNFTPSEMMEVREMALEMFWEDDANTDEFLKGCFISDEILKNEGYWEEARCQMAEIMHE